MADWVIQRTGLDPIKDVRGTYASERQFLRILRREGGFTSSCDRRLRAVGARQSVMPLTGDIITVQAPYAIRRGEVQRRATGGIFVGENMHAVITSDIGLVIAGQDQLPLLTAWTF